MRPRAHATLFAFAVFASACDRCSSTTTSGSPTSADGSVSDAPSDAGGNEPASQTWPPPYLHSTWAAVLGTEGAQYGCSAVRAAEGTTFATFFNQDGVFAAGKQAFGGHGLRTYATGYVAAFDQAGDATWAYSLPANGVSVRTTSLAADAKGDLVLLTEWNALICTPPCEVLGKDVAASSSGLVLQKLEPRRRARTPVWTRTITTLGTFGGDSLIADAHDNLYVYAWFDGDLRSDDLDLTAHADRMSRHSLLFEITRGGKLLWSRHAPLAHEAVTPDHHLALDKDGHLWTVPSLGPVGSVLSRIDAQGLDDLSISPHTLGDGGAPKADGDGIHARLVTAFPDGNIAILGVLQNVSVELGGAPLRADGKRRLFIASFAPAGVLRFARALDAVGDVDFEQMAGFDDDTLVAIGRSADYGATLAVFPRAGAPVVFRHPLRELQLGGVTRTGPREILVTGTKQVGASRDYRLFVERLTLDTLDALRK